MKLAIWLISQTKVSWERVNVTKIATMGSSLDFVPCPRKENPGRMSSLKMKSEYDAVVQAVGILFTVLELGGILLIQ